MAGAMMGFGELNTLLGLEEFYRREAEWRGRGPTT
jgi:hypothetical protein